MTKKILVSAMLLITLLIMVPSALADGENLVSNAGFEEMEGDFPDNWRLNAWINSDELVTLVPGMNGEAIKIFSEEPNDARLMQRIKVKPNKIYKLSGYIKAEGVEQGTGANLSFDNIFVGTEGLFDTQGEWQYVELYCKTQRGQREVGVLARLGGYGSLSKGTAYFDDIRFERIDKAPKGVAIHDLVESEPAKVETEEEDGFLFGKPMALISLVFIIAYFLVAQFVLKQKQKLDEPYDKHKTLMTFISLLGIGLIARVVMGSLICGYPNDIACWRGWAYTAADKGLFNLYRHENFFIDYPPGYMYILYFVGLLMKFPFLQSENAMWLLVKIPSIITDLVAAILIYKLCEKKLNTKIGVALASLYFLSPAIMTNSSAWGQIDSVLGLMVILYTLYLYRRKFVTAGIIFAVGVLLKPQMLLFAPLYILAAYHATRESVKLFVNTLLGVFAGLASFAVLVFPFAIGKEPLWIFELYFGTLGSYSTMSLNACNLWGLIGGMWTPIDTLFLGIPFKIWSGVGLALSIIIFAVIAFLDKERKNIFFYGALLIVGIFCLAGKMHERYMYGAMILLLVSFIITGRRSSLRLFGLFSFTQFANTSLVLANKYIFGGHPWTVVISILTLLGYGYMIYVAIQMLKGNEEKPVPDFLRFDMKVERKVANERIADRIKSKPYKGLFKSLTSKDYAIMAIITLVYAVVALINLGNTEGPQTMWEVKKSNQQIIVDFGEVKEISEIRYFRAQGTSGSNFTIEFSDDAQSDWRYNQHVQITSGGQYEGEKKDTKINELKSTYGVKEGQPFNVFFSNYPDVFKWFNLTSDDHARYARITFKSPMIRIMEMAFVDNDGEVIPIKSTEIVNVAKPEVVENLFDEQGTVPEYAKLENSTYFDEIYHAGTAFEHIHYYEPYETTHPPLGKVIMSWGIKLFGMTPFGWRIMGTVVGILMVPFMYLLAMMLFERTFLALATTVLMTFDFMHFVQTRIATIDSYGVFFIIAMYLCMGIYYKMNFNKQPFVKTLWPLFLSGVFFGLGAASKWICLYAGVGLAVIFFYTLFMRYQEYRLVKQGRIAGIDEDSRDEIQREFWKHIILTLLLCILFFIVIPACIYTLSYIPYLKSGNGKTLYDVWRNQLNMFNYHKGIGTEHPYASRWYEWPFIIKPMWYYYEPQLKSVGMMRSIAAFGNPLVWWVGSISMICLIIDTIMQRKRSKAAIFIIIGFLSQYLPWVLVPRSMFIYHYFASVPFIILATVYFMKRFLDEGKIKKKHIYIYLGLVVVLFAFFYPVLAGAPVSSEFGKAFKWLPTWWFTY